MSETEPKINASMDPQLEALVAQLESKFIDAEDALSELRHAVRQLKSYRPSRQEPAAGPMAPAMGEPSYTPAVTKEWADGPSALAAAEEPVTADAEAPAPSKLNHETVGVPFWPGPKKAASEPAEAAPKRTFENWGMDSTSEGSWPVGRPASAEAEPPLAHPAEAQAVEAPSSIEGDDEARREEVARVVAQMRDSGASEDEQGDVEKAAGENDKADGGDVPAMVTELGDSVEVNSEASAVETGPSGEEDDEARRQEVARMVAELRAGGGGESDQDTTASDLESHEAKQEDVTSMVAQIRAELDGGESKDQAAAPAGADPDAEVRDEVRRAVEAARAEMASGYAQGDADSDGKEADKKFSFPDWQSTHVEPSGPPVIVIKDSEGRVELARVYETLSLVHCDENAALLNYTPHSVTIGLNSKASVPEVDAMTEAVRATFGRACEVDSDGVRVNVQIGKDLKGKDSAA